MLVYYYLTSLFEYRFADAVYYQLLRPEFVQSWKKRLSADAFVGFGHDRAAEHQQEIVAATRHLLDVLCPQS